MSPPQQTDPVFFMGARYPRITKAYRPQPFGLIGRVVKYNRFYIRSPFRQLPCVKESPRLTFLIRENHPIKK